jgi:hypothetical protein
MTMSARAPSLFLLANLHSSSYIYASYFLHLHFKNMHSDMLTHSDRFRSRRVLPVPRNAHYTRDT